MYARSQLFPWMMARQNVMKVLALIAELAFQLAQLRQYLNKPLAGRVTDLHFFISGQGT
jgi:hypothetical protein